MMRAYGDLERIRTPNRQSRNLMFYPIELLGLKNKINIYISFSNYIMKY